MRLCVLSPSQDGNIDGPVLSLLRQLPGKTDSVASSDAVIVPITHFGGFGFNSDALSQLSGRKWILQDWSEFGWNDPHKTSYLWGCDRMSHPSFSGNEEYTKFDSFVRENPPILTFQRELLEADRNDGLVPIEYTSWLQEFGNDTVDQYKKRPLEAIFNWGRSSESRMHLHGAIFSEASRHGYDVIAEWDQIDKSVADNPSSKKIASIFAPHYSRIDIHNVQRFVRMARVSILAEGAGVKTFRHGEVCQDTLMAIPKNNLAWSYPWNESNSIVMPEIRDYASAASAVEVILDSLNRHDLYSIYAAAMDNGRRYQYTNYISQWIIGNIKRVL